MQHVSRINNNLELCTLSTHKALHLKPTQSSVDFSSGLFKAVWAFFNGQLPQVLHVFPKPSQSHGMSYHVITFGRTGHCCKLGRHALAKKRTPLHLVDRFGCAFAAAADGLTLCFSVDLKSH